MRYYELNERLKADKIYPDYDKMPTAQSAQQILRLIDKNWSNFFKNIKKWTQNKNNYTGQPKLPKYKNKNQGFNLILTNQEARLKNNIITFPKCFKGFTINPQFIYKNNFVEFGQVRFAPKKDCIIISLFYEINTPNFKPDNGRYLSIDIGVDNLITATNNFNYNPIIINGKGLKAINQYYNKQEAHYKSVTKKINNQNYSKRQVKFTNKRNNKINDFLHKVSHYIVNFSKENNVSVIIIGNNKDWKKGTKMGSINNQNFYYIPFHSLIKQIRYKAEEQGIKVIITEESYTSGTSFLDNELPIAENYNKKRRIKRGLFKSNTGILINSDVNGSLQIMKKVFPNAFANGIEDMVFYPIKVNIK